MSILAIQATAESQTIRCKELSSKVQMERGLLAAQKAKTTHLALWSSKCHTHIWASLRLKILAFLSLVLSKLGCKCRICLSSLIIGIQTKVMFQMTIMPWILTNQTSKDAHTNSSTLSHSSEDILKNSTMGQKWSITQMHSHLCMSRLLKTWLKHSR